VRRDIAPRAVHVELPGLAAGRYTVTEWDPVVGGARAVCEVDHPGGVLAAGPVALVADAVLVVRRAT
jgi:hypothetical protein